MLAVSDLSKHYGDRLVLDQISFNVNQGERIGLVGPNGCGKTTLLSILADEEEADRGAVSLAPGVRVGYLRQGFADLPGATLADLLDVPTDGLVTAQAALDAATERLADAGLEPDDALKEYDNALARFEALGGYSAVDELGALLAKLGLAGMGFRTSLASMSGGEKTRAGLAAILASRPDVLLLDEPTNHLDLDALEWLGGFVRDYRGAVLIVSHDRAFLDDAVSSIFELDSETHGLSVFAGNYSEYQATKRAAEVAQAEAYSRQQRDIARIERDIRAVASHAAVTERETQHDYWRGRAKKVARTAKVRERKLERRLASEEMIERPERRWGLALDFGGDHESGRDVALVEDAGVELGGRRILHDVNLLVRFGDRVALTGPNGGGKSTLIRLLAGEIAPNSGRVRIGAGVVVGRFAQEQETVDLDQTVLDQTRALAPLSETETRNFLHQFLFGGDAVFQRAGDLSYGERARLALALLVLQGANLLLLDEPLNHLDLPSRERFEEALSRFGGTMIVVLHDRYGIERIATRVLEMRDGRLREVF